TGGGSMVYNTVVLGLCIDDIGHTARTRADIVESIAEAGPRLCEMQFKDLKNKMDKSSQGCGRRGVLPIPAIFQQLVKQKYKEYCSLEYEGCPRKRNPVNQRPARSARRLTW
nr:hypothetical protein [Acidobacteriota bacterium]